MGAVYRARDTRLDRTVALKLVHSHLLGDTQMRRRFRSEALKPGEMLDQCTYRRYESSKRMWTDTHRPRHNPLLLRLSDDELRQLPRFVKKSVGTEIVRDTEARPGYGASSGYMLDLP